VLPKEPLWRRSERPRRVQRSYTRSQAADKTDEGPLHNKEVVVIWPLRREATRQLANSGQPSAKGPGRDGINENSHLLRDETGSAPSGRMLVDGHWRRPRKLAPASGAQAHSENATLVLLTMWHDESSTRRGTKRAPDRNQSKKQRSGRRRHRIARVDAACEAKVV
jgi:hypothetical protein